MVVLPVLNSKLQTSNSKLLTIPLAIRIERPAILVFIMAQNVYISIDRTNPEIQGGWAIPLVLDFLDLQDIPAHNKTDRALISLVSGVAFDFYFTHDA
jgi:hypothetical protein